jgi:hypothetical protein
MIESLKRDSFKWESDNRRRREAGYNPQSYAPASYDQSSRMDPYGDDRNPPHMSRSEGRYEDNWGSRPPNPGHDEMELDDPRYLNDPYDPRVRPPAPSGYTQPGRDPYTYDGRSNPRLDPRAEPNAGSRAYAQPGPMIVERDYPGMESRTAYVDRSAQPSYATARSDPYGAIPPSQANVIPRVTRDEPQVYIDQRTGQQVMAPPRSDVRHAPSSRTDRMDYDSRGYR